MSIRYRMIKREDYLNPEGKKKAGYYPHVVRGRTVHLKELVRRASEGTTLNPIETEAAVYIVLEKIIHELLQSNHVCLNGFGTFSLTAESRRVEQPEQIRSKSISVKRVVFVASKTLMRRIKNAIFTRVK